MLLRSPLRPLLRPVLRSPLERGGGFHPNILFASGETGDWWDPSGLPLMYQDSAGTTAAAVNQPVGLMLGQRYKGQRGAELVPVGLTDSTAGWTGSSAAVSTAAGGLRVTNTAAAEGFGNYAGLIPSAGWYEVTFDVLELSGTVGASVNVGGTREVVAAGTGTGKRCIVNSAGSNTFLGFGTRSATAGHYVTVDNVSVKALPGIHRYQTTSANRPTLKQDANGKYYLSYNGTNSWMQTSAVDFSGTDKIAFIAALTKLSDAALGAFCEHGAVGTDTAPVSFLLAPRNTATADFGAILRGGGNSISTTTPANYAAPRSVVAATLIDTAAATIGGQLAVRINGVSAGIPGGTLVPAASLQNYPLFFGARAGTSLFFNGNEYISAIAGAAKTETLIARMERFAAQRAGIVL